jgi:hypothetical protein
MRNKRDRLENGFCLQGQYDSVDNTHGRADITLDRITAQSTGME